MFTIIIICLVGVYILFLLVASGLSIVGTFYGIASEIKDEARREKEQGTKGHDPTEQ